MILLIGATGHVGSLLLEQLRQSGKDLRCFVRPTSPKVHIGDGIDLTDGDLEDISSIQKALEGVTEVVTTAFIRYAGNIIQASEAVGVRRIVFIGSTGVFSRVKTDSVLQKQEAEQRIFESELDFTLLRPTMIYGDERDRNISHMVRFIHKNPVFPIFGKGRNLMQPVYIHDLVRAILDVIDNPKTYRKSYNLSGARAYCYDDIIDLIAQALEKRVLKVHIPISLVLPVVSLYRRFVDDSRLDIHKVMRLREDKNFDFDCAQDDFGYSPVAFEEGINRQVHRMKICGVI